MSRLGYRHHHLAKVLTAGPSESLRTPFTDYQENNLEAGDGSRWMVSHPIDCGYINGVAVTTALHLNHESTDLKRSDIYIYIYWVLYRLNQREKERERERARESEREKKNSFSIGLQIISRTP